MSDLPQHGAEFGVLERRQVSVHHCRHREVALSRLAKRKVNRLLRCCLQTRADQAGTNARCEILGDWIWRHNDKVNNSRARPDSAQRVRGDRMGERPMSVLRKRDV